MLLTQWLIADLFRDFGTAEEGNKRRTQTRISSSLAIIHTNGTYLNSADI